VAGVHPVRVFTGNGQAFMCADEIISLLDMAACTGIIRQLTTGIAAEASPVLVRRSFDIMFGTISHVFLGYIPPTPRAPSGNT